MIRTRCPPPCRKVRFDTEKDALDFIARKSRSADNKLVPIRYYWSKKCKTHHVTSKPYRKQAPRTEQ